MKKRIISILLLLSMLLPLAACGNSETSDESSALGNNSTDTAEAVETADPTLDENGYLLDSLDPTLNFSDAAVNMLIRQDVANTEFYVPEDTGDVIDSALIDRNRTVEERLGIQLNFIEIAGDWAGRETMNGAIRQSVAAQDGAYDICAVLSNQLATLTLEGLLTNLNTLEHFDFEKPWWAGGLLEELSVDNKLYFASGDASLGLLGGLMCILFNKNMAANYQLPDLYKIVNEGKWTMDKIVELSENVYSDLDGSGGKSNEDNFAYVAGSNNQFYGFIESFDMPVLERDENGIPSGFVYGSERTTSIVQEMVELFKDNPGFSVEIKDTDVFMVGRALFRSGEFHDTALYRDVEEFDFGVLPMPKYEETQEYRTCARATYSSFCIPITSMNQNMASAALECFASESYRTVSPAYFETALKFKYSRDTETGQMCDLIKDSVVFNFAASFTMALNDPQNLMKNQIGGLNPNWASTIASWQPVAEKKLEEVLAKIAELP